MAIIPYVCHLAHIVLGWRYPSADFFVGRGWMGVIPGMLCSWSSGRGGQVGCRSGLLGCYLIFPGFQRSSNFLIS